MPAYWTAYSFPYSVFRKITKIQECHCKSRILHFTTNQHANRELKEICALAGINQPASEGGRTLPKSQLVTTHTARRSAATNMRLEGASLKTIADLGGWTGLSNLKLYLRASGFESSELAEGMAFFK
ncbi:MAG: tyrosine-type recombinase/integrase [Lewinellaceae bacterium]|nr:tyrosine-type recombinase/integrase [Lewinellaceae bacterium]